MFETHKIDSITLQGPTGPVTFTVGARIVAKVVAGISCSATATVLGMQADASGRLDTIMVRLRPNARLQELANELRKTLGEDVGVPFCGGEMVLVGGWLEDTAACGWTTLAPMLGCCECGAGAIPSTMTLCHDCGGEDGVYDSAGCTGEHKPAWTDSDKGTCPACHCDLRIVVHDENNVSTRVVS